MILVLSMLQELARRHRAEKRRRANNQQFFEKAKEQDFLRLLQAYLDSEKAQAVQQICFQTHRLLKIETLEVGYGFNGKQFFGMRTLRHLYGPCPVEISEFARDWVTYYSSARAAFRAFAVQCDAVAERSSKDLISRDLPISEAAE